MADEFGIGSAFGAVLGYMGQKETNEMNRELTMSGRDFNASEALINRNWQETMSNSAYQRAVEDMKKAGLNPMLAYQHGGASTPSGAQGQAPSAIPMGNKMAAAAQTAQTATVMQNTQANTAKQNAETDLTRAQEAETRARTPTHSQSIEVMQQNIKESQERIQDIIQRVKTGAASEGNLRQQTTNLAEIIPQIRQTVNLLKAQTTLTGAQTTLATKHSALAEAQTGLAGATTSETVQRTKANLPALEAAVLDLERIHKGMETPGRQLEESHNESARGAILHSLEKAIKALNPFSGIIANVPNTQPKPGPGRKDWKK